MAYTKNEWAIFNPDIPDDDQPDAFITKSKLDNISTISIADIDKIMGITPTE